MHGNAKQISAAHDSLCHELLREPTPQEVAKRMGINVDTLSRYTSEISNSVMFSFEELIQNTAQMGDALEDSMGSAPGPEENVYRKEQKQVLMEAIDSLNERERLVVSLYYYERLRLADIASVLGVSEQRVSQINSRAVAKLRVPLEKYRKG